MKLLCSILCLSVLASRALSQAWLDQLDDRLGLKTKDGRFSAHLSGLLDLEGYYIDQHPPGLLFGEESFINPRATFFVDTRAGEHFYGFLQARLDRGFDPLYKDFDARLDEYLVRWTPWTDGKLNLQFGKFATVVGSWVNRHFSWDNPLITAPLPYENITVLSDYFPPGSRTSFLRRREFADPKEYWIPIIWGPVYATGWGLFGSLGKLDYAFDLKNRSISSRPDSWQLDGDLWQYPTISGRIGFRPDPAWTHGISFSTGPYSYQAESEYFPPGTGTRNYLQTTLGYDVGYAWRKLQLWGEVFVTRFEVPTVGNADALSYYIEAKYKLTAGLFTAVRWNQQVSGTVRNDVGEEQTWDRNMVRIDLALGYRFTRHLQAKIQYSYGHRDVEVQSGPQLVAFQTTVSF